MIPISKTENKTFDYLPACKWLLKKRLETRSIFCEKLDQWLSLNYCAFCRFYARVDDNHQKPKFDNHNYNYYIADENHRGGTEEQLSPPPKEFLIRTLEKEVSN